MNICETRRHAFFFLFFFFLTLTIQYFFFPTAEIIAWLGGKVVVNLPAVEGLRGRYPVLLLSM